MPYYTTTYQSSLGLLRLVSTEDALVGLWIEGQKYYGSSLIDLAKEKKTLQIFQKANQWLTNYFEGKKTNLSELEVAFNGTDFQVQVWEILCEIPYGEVMTYGEIAKKIAAKQGKQRMSAQAVGGAVGHNPLSIIVPCHRVVGANGNLTGYAGGIETKIKLLEIEGIDMASFFIPKKGTAL